MRWARQSNYVIIENEWVSYTGCDVFFDVKIYKRLNGRVAYGLRRDGIHVTSQWCHFCLRYGELVTGLSADFPAYNGTRPAHRSVFMYNWLAVGDWLICFCVHMSPFNLSFLVPIDVI